MPHEGKDKVEDPHVPGEIELYGDPGIATFDAKVPKFLIFNYLFWPIWGFFTLWYFWNGSIGWMDRGYWHELQIAANTTFPIENQNMLPQNQPKEEQEQQKMLNP
jgi:hypothetical protein